jgi:hypothetical protein
MDYDTFQNIVSALEKYITSHNSIMCSPTKIRAHLLPTIRYESAQNITQHYRLYTKNRYSLNRLIIMIILYKYGRNTIFENCKGDCTRVDYISYKKQLNYEIIALEKFMLEY